MMDVYTQYSIQNLDRHTEIYLEMYWKRIVKECMEYDNTGPTCNTKEIEIFETPQTGS